MKINRGMFNSSIFNHQHSIYSGFTLIELLVVFSLISVITGMGFASFSNYNQEQTVTQAAQDIKLVFDNAKFNALSSVKSSVSCVNSSLIGYKVVVCATSICLEPDTSSDYYQINVMCSDTDSLLYAKKLPQNVSIDGTSTCGIVKYNTLSNLVEGVPCTLTIRGYNMNKNVVIDEGGNASIQ